MSRRLGSGCCYVVSLPYRRLALFKKCLSISWIGRISLNVWLSIGHIVMCFGQKNDWKRASTSGYLLRWFNDVSSQIELLYPHQKMQPFHALLWTLHAVSYSTMWPRHIHKIHIHTYLYRFRVPWSVERACRGVALTLRRVHFIN